MTRPERSRLDDPTAENTSDMSTPSASGLGAGVTRADDRREPGRDEVVRRRGDQHDSTPRRYEQPADDDPVMPSDDSSLNTKI
jgi:hypothetical protein